MNYGTTVTTDLPFTDAVERVTAALAEQGFGILTTIDVKATMKTKLDLDLDDYVILGACNPHLAHQALEVDPSLGLLLPCNVVVRRVDDKTIVQALDPQVMVSLPGLPALQPVADDAGRRLAAALATLS
jgi:uncharacterized protein (DUF302 family)